MNGRILRGLAAATLLAALSVGTTNAGGWATITADPGNPSQPNAGEAFTFGFTVLQHGVTPAGWVGATLVLVNSSTGERIEAKATGQGPDGHFVATVTPTSAGYWTWQVELTDLIVETAPRPMVVADADGAAPAMDAAAVLAIIERTRNEIRTEYQSQLATQSESLNAAIAALTSDVKVLQAQRASLKKEVEALASQPAAASGSDSVPVFAVVALAVIAGAISGFGMTFLGRNQRGTPVPEGAVEEVAPTAPVLTTR
jgi:hypothetical protein